MRDHPLLTQPWHCCMPGITTEGLLLAQVQYLSNCLSSYAWWKFGLYLANYHSGRRYLSSLPAGCLLEEDSSRVHLFPWESLLAVCFWCFHSWSALFLHCLCSLASQPHKSNWLNYSWGSTYSDTLHATWQATLDVICTRVRCKHKTDKHENITITFFQRKVQFLFGWEQIQSPCSPTHSTSTQLPCRGG